jgi:fibro-slime domain-containing protein
VCGNGVLEQGEACDQGADNGLFYGDGLGCSKTCLPEPQCRVNGVTGACQPVCGDGNRDPSEACDDGNRRDGDGCSGQCTLESGFVCNDQKESDAQPCPSNPSLSCLVLPVTYRDFDGQNVAGGHPDFFFLGASSTSPVPHTTGVSPGATMTTCVPSASGTKVTGTDGSCPGNDDVGSCSGIAQSALGPNGKPTLGTSTCPCVFTDWDRTGLLGTCPTSDLSTAMCTPAAALTAVQDCWISGSGGHRLRVDTTVKVVESAASFAQWYTDSTFSTKVPGTLELASIGGGLYQFSSSVPGATAGTAARTVQDDIHAICLEPSAPRTGTLSSGFFPLEAESRSRVCNIWPYWLPALGTSCCAGSSCPVKYQWDPLASYDNCPTTGTGGYVPRSDGGGGQVNGMLRNFYFTTEAHYYFRYDGTGGTLSFFGDDDLWVFINGRRAIDLGAPHARIQQSVTLSAANAATYGLETGKTYEIAVFHAERHPRESNFQLSLPDFGRVRSVCQPG